MGTVASASPRKNKVVGILSTISHRHFTADVLKHFNMSPVPLGLAKIENTTLKSLMFNKKAQVLLKGISISTQYDSLGNESVCVEIPPNMKQ
ncbi:hypothetical protein BDF20DRAFT_826402 [Mycotypha africana]|uniref:uncharacterized protein n=1 Tax=Mycotypha africana TaxID=64632 RepID=UPI002300E44D|nr:uncharacterized protein BDF20DRAFT_826402 [Mycotypha africana]KAI8970335.1 hypothetical protein BDF20DRAFT_826402 [Mycotypha africana]